MLWWHGDCPLEEKRQGERSGGIGEETPVKRVQTKCQKKAIFKERSRHIDTKKNILIVSSPVVFFGIYPKPAAGLPV